MKSKVTRILLLCVLLAGAAFMRFLSSETAGTILCEQIEKLASQSLPEAAISIEQCAIHPWESELKFKGVKFLLKGSPAGELNIGAISLQIHRPDVILHRRLRLGRVSISDVVLNFDLSALQEQEEPPQQQGSSAGSGSTCPVTLMDYFRVEQFRLTNADISLRLPGGRFARLDDITAFLHSSTVKHTLKLSTGEGELLTGGTSFPISALKLSSEIDLAAEELSLVHAEIDAGDISVFSTGSLTNLCSQPHANLLAQTSIPLSLIDAILPDLKLGAQGRASIHARVTGTLDAPEAEGDLTLRQAVVSDFKIGNVYLAAKLEEGIAAIRKLRLEVGDGRIEATGKIDLSKEDFPSSFKLELKKIGFGRLVDMLTLTGAWPDFIASGQAAVSGTLAPFHLSGKAGLDVRNFKVFDRAWNAPKRAAMLEFAPARLSTDMDFSLAGARLSNVSIQTANSKIGAEVFLSFDVDKGLDLKANVETLDLGKDLRHIVGIPWSGIMEGSVRIKGPYSLLDIQGSVTGRRMTFQSLNFGNTSMELHFGGKDGSLLDFRDIQIQRGRSRFSAKGALDFRGKEPEGRGKAVFDGADLADFVDMLEGSHWIFGMLKNKSSAKLSGTAQVKGELLKPESLVEIKFSNFVYYGREFGNADFVFSTRDGEVISIDKFDTDGPVGKISAKGQILLSEGLEFDISGPKLSLHALSLPQAADKEIHGFMDLTARLEGPFDGVFLRGEATLSDTEVMGIHLGAGQLDIGMDDGVLWLLGPIGEAILAEARMDTAGDMPFAADLKISTRKLEDYLPLNVQGLSGQLKATSHISGTVEDLDAMTGDLQVERFLLGKGRMRIWARQKFDMSFNGQGDISLPHVLLRGTDELMMNVSLDKSGMGTLRGSASGDFNARLVELFTDSVEQMGGTVKADILVAGTTEAPSLMGSLTLTDVHGDLADIAVSARDLDGTISITQNKIFIDEIRGEVNEGPMTLAGGIQLSDDYSPHSLDLKLNIDSASMTIPEWLPSTVSGAVQVTGTFDALQVTGDASISNVRYQRDIGIDPKSLLSKIGERAPKFMNIEQENEWIRFDLNVHFGDDIWLSNNLVNARIGGDVQLVGSNLNLGLIGTVQTEDQSKAFFRGNEFELKRATIDFTDRNRIAAILDIQGETELRDYRVYLHVLGSLDEPEVTLSSEPSLEQADILMLLTLGFTTKETDMASSSVGIGLIGETLLNLSGIDQQVKRFIPKNPLLKDFNIQLSTQYSEVSGTVEPMAQLESKIFTDDLKLRFSQPVLSTKGRQAHLEYKFNEHVSTQMQWNDESNGSSMGDLGVDLKLRWEFE